MLADCHAVMKRHRLSASWFYGVNGPILCSCAERKSFTISVPIDLLENITQTLAGRIVRVERN